MIVYKFTVGCERIGHKNKIKIVHNFYNNFPMNLKNHKNKIINIHNTKIGKLFIHKLSLYILGFIRDPSIDKPFFMFIHAKKSVCYQNDLHFH